MSKTSKTTFRNKELEDKLGKIRYRIREIDDALAQKEVSDFEEELNKNIEDCYPYESDRRVL